MSPPFDRAAVLAQIARQLAGDEALLQLLTTSYKEPEKTEFQGKLAAMIPRDAAPFIDSENIYEIVTSYCGCVLPMCAFADSLIYILACRLAAFHLCC